jgi:hypothetical protein
LSYVETDVLYFVLVYALDEGIPEATGCTLDLPLLLSRTRTAKVRQKCLEKQAHQMAYKYLSIV